MFRDSKGLYGYGSNAGKWYWLRWASWMRGPVSVLNDDDSVSTQSVQALPEFLTTAIPFLNSFIHLFAL